ncbi:MAG: nucleotide pyrophosphohydrolase [Emergencia sp.]
MNTQRELTELRDLLRGFTEERDWDQFHSPENLAKSVSIEAGELLECFQWNSDFDLRAVSDEIADVMMYCIMLADKIGIDLKGEILRKLEENKKKYPVEKSRGSSKKYDELEE